jgi:hypothetical protein
MCSCFGWDKDGDLLAIITDKSPNLIIWDAHSDSGKEQLIDTSKSFLFFNKYTNKKSSFITRDEHEACPLNKTKAHQSPTKIMDYLWTIQTIKPNQPQFNPV